MTGRELIVYILENGLENEPIFKNGKPIGFITHIEAAKKFGVGAATIKVWSDRGYIQSLRIEDVIYIPANAEPHLDKGVTKC